MARTICLEREDGERTPLLLSKYSSRTLTASPPSRPTAAHPAVQIGTRGQDGEVERKALTGLFATHHHRLLEPWLHPNARRAGTSVRERARRTRKGTSTHRTGLAGLDSEKEPQTAQYYFFPQFKCMVLNRQNGYTRHCSQRSPKHTRRDHKQGVWHHCTKEPPSPAGMSIPTLAQIQALLVTMEGVESNTCR